MQTISNIASIATLILFVFYFVGRIITIIRSKPLYSDKIYIRKNTEELSSFNIVDEISLEDSNFCYIIQSEEGMYSLKILKISYCENMEEYGKRCIKEYHFLNQNQSVSIIADVPDVVVRYEIQYYTYDFRKVVFPLGSCGKNTVITEMVKPKHTVKSVLYCLFR